MSEKCPCGLETEFEDCCGLIHKKMDSAISAEQLMRARYSAFVKADIEFLENSLIEEKRESFVRSEALEWSQSSEWLGLEIVSTIQGKETDDRGVVEFKAKYKTNSKDETHHELSRFRCENGCWYYVDGELVDNGSSRIGRNDPCPCDSGKKFKKCCGKNNA